MLRTLVDHYVDHDAKHVSMTYVIGNLELELGTHVLWVCYGNIRGITDIDILKLKALFFITPFPPPLRRVGGVSGTGGVSGASGVSGAGGVSALAGTVRSPGLQENEFLLPGVVPTILPNRYIQRLRPPSRP